MKCTRATALIIAISICLAGCSNAQESSNARNALRPDRKILIVYLSRTNNTKVIAEVIQSEVGGNLMPLELDKPYPDDYRATVEQVARENETGFLPKLRTKIDRIEQYDIVFVGFPTWGMQLPPPVKSFLKQYDLKGKTVIPFNTNGGYGVGSSFSAVKELCVGCNVAEGFTTRGGSERDGIILAIKDGREVEARNEVREWLGRIKIEREQRNEK
jgi:flavodoxin